MLWLISLLGVRLYTKKSQKPGDYIMRITKEKARKLSALLQEVQQDLIDEMLEDNIPESEALDDENVESIQSIIDLVWWIYLR